MNSYAEKYTDLHQTHQKEMEGGKIIEETLKKTINENEDINRKLSAEIDGTRSLLKDYGKKMSLSIIFSENLNNDLVKLLDVVYCELENLLNTCSEKSRE